MTKEEFNNLYNWKKNEDMRDLIWRRFEQEMKEQAEIADDHFASCLADFVWKLKKIQIIADPKTDKAIQELINEIKNE